MLDGYRAGTADHAWVVARLRTSLEHSLDLLLEVAHEIGIDLPDARSTLATRDAVESHLRASADIEAADARSEVFTKVLVDAAELLITEAGGHRPTTTSSRPHRR